MLAHTHMKWSPWVAVGLLAIFVSMPVLSMARVLDWTEAATRIQQSLVRITRPVAGGLYVYEESGQTIFVNVQMQMAVCSGSVIHAAKEYVLTANHCYGPDISVDGKQAWAVFRDEKFDLMVLRVERLGKPAVRPSHRELRPGLPAAAYGYGYGADVPLFRAGQISALNFDLSPHFPGLWMVFDQPYIGGMSGGPVFDIDGRILGIVQLSDTLTGSGKTIADILPATRYYWEAQ